MLAVSKQLSTAIDFDDSKRYKEAFDQYCVVISLISTTLRQVLVEKPTIDVKKDPARLFHFARESLTRAQTIYDHMFAQITFPKPSSSPSLPISPSSSSSFSTQGNQFSQNRPSPSNLPSSPSQSPSQTSQPSVKIDEIEAYRRKLDAMFGDPTARPPGSGSGAGAKMPGSFHQQQLQNLAQPPPKLDPQVAALVRPQLNASWLRSTDPISAVKGDLQNIRAQNQQIFESLGNRDTHSQMLLMRKLAENQAIQEMHEVALDREKRRQNEELRRAVRVDTRATRQQLRRQARIQKDKWSHLIADHFTYDKLHPKLREFDEQWLVRVKQLTSSQYANNNNDDDAADNIPSPNNDITAREIRQHLEEILAPPAHGDPTHALLHVIEIFSDHFVVEATTATVQNVTTESALDRFYMTELAHDVNTFIERLVSAVLLAMPVLDCDTGEQVLTEVIERAVFSRIYPVLFSLFKQVVPENKRNDDILREKFRLFNSRGITPEHLQIPRQFRLGIGTNRVSSDAPYQRAIDMLGSQMQLVFSPSEKLQALVDSVDVLGQCITEYWNQQRKANPRAADLPSEDDLVLGADDMLPIFTYVLIKAAPNDSFTMCNYIEDFSDNQTLHGKGGYCLATLQTSLSYILSVEWDELENSGRTTQGPPQTPSPTQPPTQTQTQQQQPPPARSHSGASSSRLPAKPLLPLPPLPQPPIFADTAAFDPMLPPPPLHHYASMSNINSHINDNNPANNTSTTTATTATVTTSVPPPLPLDLGQSIDTDFLNSLWAARENNNRSQ